PTGGSGMANRRTHLIANGTVERAPAKSMALPTDVSIWEPMMMVGAKAPTTSEVLQQTREPGRLSRELEASLLSLLTRPIDLTAGHTAGYAVREQEIGQAFSQLDVQTAHVLSRRLELARYDDAIATAFNRMVSSRRIRLKGFLANARKRAAT
ncbi:MAG: hypothetical protein WKG01_27710, partial [Kofleriaceae bacterium]